MKLSRHPRAGLGIGIISFLTTIVIYGGAEPQIKSEKRVSLEQLQTIPASTFTKIIDESTSPNRRLAVGVGSLDGSKPVWGKWDREGKGGSIEHTFSIDEQNCANYLIDLRTDRVICLLDSRHWGTTVYNHNCLRISWSPDSRWLVEAHQFKWATGACTVHRVSPEGLPENRLSLKATAKKVVHERLLEISQKLTPEDLTRFLITIYSIGISNDGRLTTTIIGTRAKVESITAQLSIDAKVEQGEMEDLTISVTNVSRHQE